MKLREFKALMLTKILSLKKELLQKYPERSERIEQLTELLIHKTQNLRIFTLSDYIHTLYLASKEFPEFEKIMPSANVVEELLRDEDYFPSKRGE